MIPLLRMGLMLASLRGALEAAPRLREVFRIEEDTIGRPVVHFEVGCKDIPKKNAGILQKTF